MGPARLLPRLQHDDTLSEKQCVLSLQLIRLSLSTGEGQYSVLGSVCVAGAIYSLEILEEGVMFLSLSAAVVEDNG